MLSRHDHPDSWRSDDLDDRLSIGNWKTGILLVNMVRAFPPQISIGRTTLICERLIAQPIRAGSWFDPVVSFLDNRHFVIPSVLAELLSKVLLNIYWLALSLDGSKYHHRRSSATTSSSTSASATSSHT